MGNGPTQAPSSDSLEQTETKNLPSEKEQPKKRLPARGFRDPEVRRKATEKSLARRRHNAEQSNEFLFDPTEFKDLGETDFRPTKAMLQVLYAALSLEGGATIRGWFAQAGINRGMWYHWRRVPGFIEWWNVAFAKGVEQYRTQWLMIGLRKMSKDFRYWDKIGEKVFGYLEKISVKTERSDAEEKLIQELVGVFEERKNLRRALDITKVEDITEDEISDETLEQLERMSD